MLLWKIRSDYNWLHTDTSIRRSLMWLDSSMTRYCGDGVYVCVGGAVGVPTCDDTWSLSSHYSLRESSKLLREERRSSQSSEHRRSHCLLNAPQNQTDLILWKKHQVLQKYIYYGPKYMRQRRKYCKYWGKYRKHCRKYINKMYKNINENTYKSKFIHFNGNDW